MNNFLKTFAAFSPAEWFDCGITTRDEVAPASMKPAAMQPSGAAVFASAVIAIAGLVAAAPASVHAASLTPLDEINVRASITASGGEVTAGYWPSLVSKLSALKKLEESTAPEIESLF